MSSPQNQSRPDSSDKPKQLYQATFEETQSFLESILSQISSRFTKKYLPPIETLFKKVTFSFPLSSSSVRTNSPFLNTKWCSFSKWVVHLLKATSLSK